MMRGLRVASFTVAALLYSSLTVIGTGCARRDDVPPEQPVAVRVAQVRLADLEESISYLGTIRSEHEVLLAARVQGTVVGFEVEEGAPVVSDEILVHIDAPQLDAAVARSQADDTYWANHLAQDRRLVELGAISPEQVAASTRAAAAARSALVEAEARMAWTVERSPLSGTVLEWLADPGQHVLPGQPLMRLAGSTREVRVQVVEEDLRRGIRVQTPVVVEVHDGHTFTTTVSDVGATASRGTRAFIVTLSIPDTPGLDIRNGESVPVRFIIRRQDDASAVPVRAVADQHADPHVYLVENELAVRWTVATGVMENGWVTITPPPPAGSVVAVSNLEELTDGVAVFPVVDEGVKP